MKRPLCASIYGPNLPTYAFQLIIKKRHQLTGCAIESTGSAILYLMFLIAINCWEQNHPSFALSSQELSVEVTHENKLWNSHKIHWVFPTLLVRIRLVINILHTIRNIFSSAGKVVENLHSSLPFDWPLSICYFQ